MGPAKIQSSQKITPFLWFDHQAEKAARFYVSIFRKSRILKIARVTEQAARKIGQTQG
ncbi:MAG TPA: VOC family protein, partial [Verrucomicrobiae bacterium]